MGINVLYMCGVVARSLVEANDALWLNIDKIIPDALTFLMPYESINIALKCKHRNSTDQRQFLVLLATIRFALGFTGANISFSLI